MKVFEAGMSVTLQAHYCPSGFFVGKELGGHVQPPTHGLSNLTGWHTIITDGVECYAGGRVLSGQAVSARSILHMHSGPTTGPVSDITRDAPAPSRGDELSAFFAN